jgi:RNA polymerase-binding protein DksA
VSPKGAGGKTAAPSKAAGAKPGPGRGGDADDGIDDGVLDDIAEGSDDAKASASDPEKKSGRKGITIVTPKPVKKSKPGPTAATIVPPGLSAFLLKGLGRKPLIPSGPKAAATRPLGAHGGGVVEEAPRPPAKTPFSKKELDRYRQILLRKRAELVGDVNRMESEALQNDAGALSNMPSHMAEQGSDASDQSLSLDLAAADRKLIREIDAAIKRIDAGTFGICEHTGTPIKLERLEELPWARYSIEAAREIERFAMRPS